MHHPKRAGTTVNSANSANCVIPKRAVDRLDAAPGWRERRVKKIAPGAAGGQIRRGRKGRGGCASHTRMHSHHLRSMRPAQYRESFPPSWQLCHVAATTKRRDSSLPLPARPYLPFRPDPMQYTTLAYHTYFVLRHRTERACISARTRVHVSPFIYRVSR